MTSRSRKGRGADNPTLSLFESAGDPAPLAPAPIAPPAAPLVPVEEDATPSTAAPLVPVEEDATPSAAGPENWLAGAFAERLVAWARTAEAPPESLRALREAAEAVSLATAAGHACIDIGALGDFTWTRAALLGSQMVGKAHAPDARPLVLDGEGRLYLHRYFDYERRIAARLARCRPRRLDEATQREAAAQLSQRFATHAAILGDAPDWQKLATALALRNTFTVISGGPGTGKTTTIVNLLACLLAIEPDCRIALAAPTGKAAARMQDAIRERTAHLAPELQARLPAESFTIHRLLGVQPASNAFRHDASNPLPIDLLVVDEASMLDLALAAKLFDAVPEGARIVLLGDKDQLAAVESGAVFSELAADPTLASACIAELARLTGTPADRIAPPMPTTRTPLHDTVVWLAHNFRFAAESGIGRLAADIKTGDADRALDGLAGGYGPAIAWIDEVDSELSPAAVARLHSAYNPYLDALRADALARDAVFAAFERFRILCAEREGPRGVRALNESVEKLVRAATEVEWPAAPRSPWYCGRPVMVLRNDYLLNLYNGDVGIALPDASGKLLVHFRQTDGSYRSVAPVRLPEHETAFATTVHKAQGSEFDAVALVLPARASRALTRELVYTAVTRAKAALTLVAGADAVRAALAAPTVRHSGLAARLREAIATP